MASPTDFGDLEPDKVSDRHLAVTHNTRSSARHFTRSSSITPVDAPPSRPPARRRVASPDTLNRALPRQAILDLKARKQRIP
ncbi:MAG: hypothetical protein M3096_05550 [Actinomycetia bacterium]|nr:hypothetical protein [Actinomycetes bacterium]